MVQVLDQGAGVMMKDLKVGDVIFTGTQYQPVYAFGHHQPDKVAHFLQIHLEGHATPLEITKEHLVYAVGKTHPIRADAIIVGDSLQTPVQQASARVVKIAAVSKPGLYAPLTRDGTLIVNGVKVSSYVALQDDNAEYAMLQGNFPAMAHHTLAHLMMSPFRLYCSIVDAAESRMLGRRTCTWCHSYNREQDGMPLYVAYGIHLASWCDSLHLHIYVHFFSLEAPVGSWSSL